MKRPIQPAVQTWSFRGELYLDPVSILRKLASNNISKLELAGTARRSPHDFSNICQDLGFEIVALHMPPPTGNRLSQFIDEIFLNCEAFECDHIVMMFDATRPINAWEYNKFCEKISLLHESVKDKNIKIAYHVYNFDLEDIDESSDGYCGIDILAEKLQPNELMFEFDTYFLMKFMIEKLEMLPNIKKEKDSKFNLANLISPFKDRCSFIHLNDCDLTKTKLPVGDGIIDFCKLLNEFTGIKHPQIVIEQDCQDPINAIVKSISFVQEHLYFE